jgi:hypothetical protein
MTNSQLIWKELHLTSYYNRQRESYLINNYEKVVSVITATVCELRAKQAFVNKQEEYLLESEWKS